MTTESLSDKIFNPFINGRNKTLSVIELEDVREAVKKLRFELVKLNCNVDVYKSRKLVLEIFGEKLI